MVRIDIFPHILPKKYQKALLQKAKTGIDISELTPWAVNRRELYDIDIRLRLMDRYPDVVQVLTLALPPLEVVLSPSDAVELAKIANDEMAELVAKYPDKFVAAVASLPLNDIDAAVKEADRAITELGFVGVQIFSNIDGEPLDAPQFRVLYERMAQHDLPIWIHPWNLPVVGPSPIKSLPKSIQEYFDWPIMRHINWPIDTSLAMIRLARSGVFESYPNIKFITHHCGGFIPFLEGRIRNENTRKFYNDTAVRGNTGALMCGYAFFGADHLLFGTDMPLGQSGLAGVGGTLDEIRAIEQMDIPDIDKDKIFGGNAIRLLRLAV